MNQASQYLLALAKRNIQAYIANSEAKAAMVTGSTATGQADFYSDVEMFIYYDELPSIEKLRSAREQNRGSEPILTFDDRYNWKPSWWKFDEVSLRSAVSRRSTFDSAS